ncbi:hypothetical protein RFI_23607, partial [Reticulomyxa filosa]
MLGALGALIRKDVRTLFNKNKYTYKKKETRVRNKNIINIHIIFFSQKKKKKRSDGLFVIAPKASHEIEEEFLENVGYRVRELLLQRWPFEDFVEIRSAFEHCRIRVLYISDESLEWVVYTPYGDGPLSCPGSPQGQFSMDELATKYGETKATPKEVSSPSERSGGSRQTSSNGKSKKKRSKKESSERDLQCIAGVYQKFNFEFGDGKFHDIISMATTYNVPWSVANAHHFDPSVLSFVGSTIATTQSIATLQGECRLPNELWHLIMTFAVDCFKPIENM